MLSYLLLGRSCSSGLWGPVAMTASCVSQCVSGACVCACRSWCDTPMSSWKTFGSTSSGTSWRSGRSSTRRRIEQERIVDMIVDLRWRCVVGRQLIHLTQGKVACPLQIMMHLCIPKLQFGVQQVVQTIQFLSLDLCLPGSKWQYCCSDTHPQSQHSLLLRYEI